MVRCYGQSVKEAEMYGLNNNNSVFLVQFFKIVSVECIYITVSLENFPILNPFPGNAREGVGINFA